MHLKYNVNPGDPSGCISFSVTFFMQLKQIYLEI